MHKRSIAIFILILLISSPSRQEETKELDPLPIDVSSQLQTGINPLVTIDSGNSRSGRFRIVDQPWWMFFVHTRPLKNAPDLSISEVETLLLSFWGNPEESGVSLTGDKGKVETEMGTAYWADAKFKDGTVLTRFLVWDDLKKKRRIITDMNISLNRATPDSLLHVVQQAMALTVRPRKHKPSGDLPDWLSDRVEIKELDLSLYIPLHTKAEIFPRLDIGRGRVSKKKWGSVWVLPVGIEWRYDLSWGVVEPEPVEEWVSALLPDSLSGGAEMTVMSLKLTPISRGFGYGEVTTGTRYKGVNHLVKWEVIASQWLYRNISYRTIVASQAHEGRLGVLFDGSIPDHLLENRAQIWLENIPSAPPWPYAE